MNTVVNQLVKEAAYHAAKYDSTIQAINALTQNGMNKTAGALDDLMTAGSGLKDLWGTVFNGANTAIPASDIPNLVDNVNSATGSYLQDIADAGKKGIGEVYDFLSGMGARSIARDAAHAAQVDQMSNSLMASNPLLSNMRAANDEAYMNSINNMINNRSMIKNFNPNKMVENLSGGLVSAGTVDNATNISNAMDAAKNYGIAMKQRAIQSLAGAPSSIMSEFSIPGEQAAAGIAGLGALGLGASAVARNQAAQAAAAQQAAQAAQAAQINQLKGQLAAANTDNGSLLANLGQRLRNAGSSAWEAIKANPGTAAAVGLGGAGLAALPFLMGSEKDSSYDPARLEAIRTALVNMR